MQNEEQVLRSITLAERFAAHELRLKRLQRLKAPQVILKKEDDFGEKLRRKVQQDIVATELLPQARIRVRASEARREAIEESTILGKLLEGFETLQYIAAGALRNHEFNPFTHELDITAWKRLRLALKRKDLENIVDALVGLLIYSKMDLVFQELPPVPPPYLFHDRIYSPKELN